MKPIVTDTYDFSTLIKRGYVYVDKTALLHRMISGVDGTCFFMSRPRRFGKSLMISTLEQIFKGNKVLFKGLAISKTKYGWKKYPVIRLDMSVLNANSASEYRRVLCAVVAAEAARHGLTLEENVQPAWMLNQLIGKLAVRNRKVVVLVDEYDAPLGGLLSDLKMLEAVHELLHDFYIMLKARVADIRFLMMTGVSKFSKLSVFLGLNNLTDISMHPEYAGLLGYTPDELDEFFGEHLKAFAKDRKMSPTTAKSMLLSWYAADHRKVICIGLNYNAKAASLDAPLIASAINGKVNGKVNEWIAAHSGCKRAELIKAIGKSARTVDRALAELIAERIVEFRGAPKTGGYYAK